MCMLVCNEVIFSYKKEIIYLCVNEADGNCIKTDQLEKDKQHISLYMGGMM